MTKYKWLETTVKRKSYFLISLLGCLISLVTISGRAQAKEICGNGCDSGGLCWKVYPQTWCGYGPGEEVPIGCSYPTNQGVCPHSFDCRAAYDYLETNSDPGVWYRYTKTAGCTNEEGKLDYKVVAQGYCTPCPNGGMTGNECNGVSMCVYYWTPSPEEYEDIDGDGYSSVNGDCNDNNPAMHPYAPEICDGFDNDCDVNTSENFDGDGDGVSECGGDCNDSDPKLTTDCLCTGTARTSADARAAGTCTPVTLSLDVDNDFETNLIDDIARFSPGYISDQEVGIPQSVRVCLYIQGNPAPYAGKFVNFSLSKASSYPGSAMNFPSVHPDTGPDLVLRDHEDAIDTSGIACAVVEVWDYAAYGVVKAEFEVNSQTIINTITLPLDQDGNHIADTVEHNALCSNKLDADAESLPIGDGYPGDGLSCAEEYRGFMIMDGTTPRHVRTDPTMKELFLHWVSNQVPAPLKTPGGYFSKATGVVTYLVNYRQIRWYPDTYTESPLSYTGMLINFNTTNQDVFMPHTVNQSGVALFIYSKLDSTAATVVNDEKLALEHPGISEDDLKDYVTPNDVIYVVLSPYSKTQDEQVYLQVKNPIEEYNANVQHEIGHALGINHHGPASGEPGSDIPHAEYVLGPHSIASGPYCSIRYILRNAFYYKEIEDVDTAMPYFMTNPGNPQEYNNSQEPYGFYEFCQSNIPPADQVNGGSERVDPTDDSKSTMLRLPKTYETQQGRGGCYYSFCVSDARKTDWPPNKCWSDGICKQPVKP